MLGLTLTHLILHSLDQMGRGFDENGTKRVSFANKSSYDWGQHTYCVGFSFFEKLKNNSILHSRPNGGEDSTQMEPKEYVLLINHPMIRVSPVIG